jgi:hypothetical protein
MLAVPVAVKLPLPYCSLLLCDMPCFNCNAYPNLSYVPVQVQHHRLESCVVGYCAAHHGTHLEEYPESVVMTVSASLSRVQATESQADAKPRSPVLQQ